MASADPLHVALYVRLFRLLADRPEFLTRDVGARIDAAWTDDKPGSLVLLDRVLVAHMSELDSLCGYAVAKLRAAAAAPVLDVLGILEPERIVAMYCSLPPRRRGTVVRDAVWAYHVNHADLDAIAAAGTEWDEMPDVQVPTDLAPDAQRDYHRFVREATRLRVDLPHDLTDDELGCVIYSPNISDLMEGT